MELFVKSPLPLFSKEGDLFIPPLSKERDPIPPLAKEWDPIPPLAKGGRGI